MAALASFPQIAKQIFIQFTYGSLVLLMKELLFITTRRNNTSMYWAEFTADFFYFMALQNITSWLTFALNILHECVGILYQLVRISDWWYLNVEMRYTHRLRSWLLGGGLLEEMIAIITVKSLRTLRVRSFEEPQIQEVSPSDRLNYRRHICRNLLLVSLAKSFAPLAYIVILSQSYLSYNRKYWPWSGISTWEFHNLLVLSAVAFFCYIAVAAFSFVAASYYMKENALKSGTHHIKTHYTLCLVAMLGGFTVPFVLVPLQSNTWYYFFNVQ
jgi:hypothetical protein